MSLNAAKEHKSDYSKRLSDKYQTASKKVVDGLQNHNFVKEVKIDLKPAFAKKEPERLSTMKRVNSVKDKQMSTIPESQAR